MPASEGLTSSQRAEIDAAVRSAEITSRFEFSVYIGVSDHDPRAFAERLHASLTTPARTVLVMVDPTRRRLEIVTGEVVRRNLADDQARLAIVTMQSAFAEGDLVGGITRGLAQLAEAARAPRTLHAESAG